MLFYVPVEAAQKIGPLDFFINATSRYESRRDIGFDSADEEHRTNWLNRVRLGFDYQPSPESTIRVTYQYAHINTKDEDGDGGGLSPDFNPTGDWEGRTRQDLLEANITRSWMTSTFTIGRQQVDRDWLVGSNKWGEVGRAWTGVSGASGAWDFFVGRLDLDTIGETGFGSDQHLAYGGFNWGEWGRTTLYYKKDRDFDVSIYTLGHEYKRDFGNAHVMVNGATQWGRESGNYVAAWAAIGKIAFDMGDRLSFYGAYTTASGGTTSAGTVRTFNDLYPSDHYRLGIMDLQALSNVRAFSVGAHYNVSADIGLGFGYHTFELFDEDDFWYNTSNVYGNPYGTGFGTRVGSEFDVTVHWRLSDMLKVHGGFGLFDPGSFIENAAAAGLDTATDNSRFFYVGVNLRY